MIESMVTSQRYVDGAGTQNREAAARNPLYGLIERSGATLEEQLVVFRNEALIGEEQKVVR